MNIENISITELLFIGTTVWVWAWKLLAYTAEKASDIYYKNRSIYIDLTPSIIEKMATRVTSLLPRKTK
jgi:hypothetical protein